MNEVTPEMILSCHMQENDANAATIKEYLHALLSLLWKNGEGFSSKRPFGNSGWQYELYQALVFGHLIPGDVDEDGYADNYNRDAADDMITTSIENLFK